MLSWRSILADIGDPTDRSVREVVVNIDVSLDQGMHFIRAIRAPAPNRLFIGSVRDYSGSAHAWQDLIDKRPTRPILSNGG
jgi:hypothetical protein